MQKMKMKMVAVGEKRREEKFMILVDGKWEFIGKNRD